jgi:type I restriction enzyme S subunit
VADPQKVRDLWLEPGDLLIERSNTPELVGTARLYRGPRHFAIFPDLLIRARFGPEVLPEFAELQLHSERARFFFTQNAQGTAGSMPKIDQELITRFPFVLPPLSDQKRIVQQIDALLAHVNAARERLTGVREILKRFCQSVLAAAVSGRLTEDWRAAQTWASDASDLIQGRPMDVTGALPALPESWHWSAMEQVADIRSGIQKQPKRHPRNHSYPYLRVANVLRGKLDLDHLERMELFAGELELYRLVSGDLLVVEGNGSLGEIGRSAVWTGEIRDCVHQNHIIRVRPRRCSARFLDEYWNSPVGVAQVSAAAVTSSGLYSLSTRKVARLPVPVPPLEEQQEIVRRVDSLMAAATEVEERVAAATRADKLPQAVLAMAFRGKLGSKDSRLTKALPAPTRRVPSDNGTRRGAA